MGHLRLNFGDHRVNSKIGGAWSASVDRAEGASYQPGRSEDIGVAHRNGEGWRLRVIFGAPGLALLLLPHILDVHLSPHTLLLTHCRHVFILQYNT